MHLRKNGAPLWLAITLALIAKLVILVMLHRAFFSAPQVKKMRMPIATVEQHFLNSASKEKP